jgi:hypothetical protein
VVAHYGGREVSKETALGRDAWCLTGLAGSASSPSSCYNGFDKPMHKLIASPIKRQAKTLALIKEY